MNTGDLSGPALASILKRKVDELSDRLACRQSTCSHILLVKRPRDQVDQYFCGYCYAELIPPFVFKGELTLIDTVGVSPEILAQAIQMMKAPPPEEELEEFPEGEE